MTLLPPSPSPRLALVPSHIRLALLPGPILKQLCRAGAEGVLTLAVRSRGCSRRLLGSHTGDP